MVNTNGILTSSVGSVQHELLLFAIKSGVCFNGLIELLYIGELLSLRCVLVRAAKSNAHYKRLAVLGHSHGH